MLGGDKAYFDEHAVMLDARDALDVADLPEDVECPDYVESWRGKRLRTRCAREWRRQGMTTS